MNGSAGIIFSSDKEKVLLVKRRDIPVWVLPGGCAEIGESPEETAKREAFEETGFQTKIQRKIGEYTYPGTNKVSHTFVCTI